ncbi:hypothetical protein [Vibrio celticus]|nr:hypothetical protein [Vibrio celticus]
MSPTPQSLDTTDPEQNDEANSIVFDDDLVNEDEADSVTLSRSG